ncbi:hypothetical protein CASFOL_029313 [Castilleja foliolosa]|uniref:Uncharacterized protein n=1 Tax=Castilleja foliolosa TaxID=1961234 RepID=A0ABD3CB75_9LAMI
MEASTRKLICIFLMCVLVESTTSFRSSSHCGLDYKTFLQDFNCQCPFTYPSASPIQGKLDNGKKIAAKMLLKTSFARS